MIGFHFVSQRIGVIAIVIDEQPQRPDAGVVGDGLDRIGAEVAPERAVDAASANGHEAGEEHGGLEHPPYELRLRHRVVVQSRLQ